ncbi:nuclear transport factor 2 family protein [Streptomyces sp. MBT56]|nr:MULTISPECIES: nuclear transport factor 2 family protein [unclassified Streptomyces]MBK3559942.1 nuclear transport factor 2 family protein [Streptomyces sp. MBT56]MBK3605416.1 nuclear transport factor 2 family protein [Streptomyces sp. MBT54]MBK3618345.1 nuclear transport factor 2 family protein [Streptomyces sp. MBT98]MBK6043787.1 nuclear transport factor 2 family protein [Streptomyces sp. MBT55]
MTQRVALATVLDRLAIDALITGYAVAVDDGAWSDYGALFTPDGRVDYRGAGGVEGPVEEVARWLEETMRLFPVRQHLIVNRRIDLEDLGGYTGDRAEVRADYLNPMCLARQTASGPDAGEAGAGRSGAATPDFVTGGRYTFTLHRAEAGWLIRTVTVHEKWRRAP